METLRLTNNSKVRFRKLHYNTFSLNPGKPEDGGTCPCSTEGKEGCLEKCYDKSLNRIYPNYQKVEQFNTELLKDKTTAEMRQILTESISVWRYFAREDKYFRIHTGGDFFSKDYARAWKSVINKNKDINFWAYTRSLFAVPILAECKNLALYISCDPVNINEAVAVYEKYKHYPNLGIAWMGNNLPNNFPQDRFVLVCPAVTGKFKKDKEKGACARCRSCIDRYSKNKLRNIQFPIHR